LRAAAKASSAVADAKTAGGQRGQVLGMGDDCVTATILAPARPAQRR